MLIHANIKEFVPTNFVILDFYGEEMCFAWCNKLIVVFPYSKTSATSILEVNSAPANISSLRCFNGRVFVRCRPVGVYKFMKSYKFMALSSTGITNGPTFYEVFESEDNWLCLYNRANKSNRQLFQLESSSSGALNLRDITLNKTNSELRLRQAIQEDDRDSDICLLANNKRVFKITQNNAQIIYRSEHKIVDIVEILRGESIAGVVLITDKAVVLVYVVKGKLIFDKVYLDTEVRGLCAGTSNDFDDMIWLAHIDDTRIHYWSKTISENTFRKTKMEYARFLAIKNYKSQFLICLSDANQLIEMSIDHLGLERYEREEFFPLKSEMLKGTEKIVDAICDRAKELQNCNDTLLREHDKLKRLNIYSHKQRIVYLPKIRVERMADRLFARITFDGILPLNCHVIVAITSNQRTTYCVKYVKTSETTMDLSLDNVTLDESMRIVVNLVTIAEESKAWLIIDDYTKKPQIETNVQIPSERSNFLNAKLTALRNLARGGATMANLSAIKKSIRREL